MKLDLFIEPYTKTNSKQIEDFNICPKTIKFLEENTGDKLLDIDLGSNFFVFNSKGKAAKAILNKQDYLKLESFCTEKEIISEIKREPMEWEKYQQTKYPLINIQNIIELM